MQVDQVRIKSNHEGCLVIEVITMVGDLRTYKLYPSDGFDNLSITKCGGAILDRIKRDDPRRLGLEWLDALYEEKSNGKDCET